MSTIPHNEFATAHIRMQQPILASAVAGVHTALTAIHGVRSVTVSLDMQEANVRFDLYDVNPLQFKRALFIIGMSIDTIMLTFDHDRGAGVSSTEWRRVRSSSEC